MRPRREEREAARGVERGRMRRGAMRTNDGGGEEGGGGMIGKISSRARKRGGRTKKEGAHYAPKDEGFPELHLLAPRVRVGLEPARVSGGGEGAAGDGGT